MIGRERVVFRWKNDDGDPVEKVMRCVVSSAHLDGKLEPFGNSMVFKNYYRLMIPRSLNLAGSGASAITVSFRDRDCVKMEAPPVPVYDRLGRVHHYEAVLRSS